MSFILNIGLDGIPSTGTSYTNGLRNPSVLEYSFAAVQAARALNFKLLRTKLLTSDTEPTLVAEVVHTGDIRACTNWLAEKLNQDCIAIYDTDTGVGQLIGPKAAAWGDFNPAFFFLLDGSRLAAPLQAAA